MSTRDRDDVDPEDLIVRARHGTLSRAEHDALSSALEQNPLLATAYRVGVEIDRASAVQGGDDALIARAADAALARAALTHTELTTRRPTPSRAPAGSRWAMAAAAVLSVVCASGIATALWTGAIAWPSRREPEASTPSAAPALSQHKAKRMREKSVLTQPAPPVAVAAEPVVIAAPAKADEPLEASVAAQRARKASTASSAADAFHAANDARRNGELARARSLYTKLIAQHPSSDEAGLARVSLGRLLLSAGDARAAEREFRRYLMGGSGQLAEEALVGQAQSLGRLQRVDEEAQVWRRLLATHPSSLYAAEGERRLAALAQAHDEGSTR
jgi:TolA-binding protein